MFNVSCFLFSKEIEIIMRNGILRPSVVKALLGVGGAIASNIVRNLIVQPAALPFSSMYLPVAFQLNSLEVMLLLLTVFGTNFAPFFKLLKST